MIEAIKTVLGIAGITAIILISAFVIAVLIKEMIKEIKK